MARMKIESEPEKINWTDVADDGTEVERTGLVWGLAPRHRARSAVWALPDAQPAVASPGGLQALAGGPPGVLVVVLGERDARIRCSVRPDGRLTKIGAGRYFDAGCAFADAATRLSTEAAWIRHQRLLERRAIPGGEFTENDPLVLACQEAENMG
jgi:hypothetical protein